MILHQLCCKLEQQNDPKYDKHVSFSDNELRLSYSYAELKHIPWGNLPGPISWEGREFEPQNDSKLLYHKHVSFSENVIKLAYWLYSNA